MGYPEQVRSSLWGIVCEMSDTPWVFAKSPGTDFTRRRKLCFEDLLRLLISMQSGTVCHEILKYFDYDTDALSVSAFYQQRAKLLPQALPYALNRFNECFPLSLYKGKYTLVACDGCEFNIARDPTDPDTFHPPNGKSTRGFNMIHTVSLFDILNKRYLDCVIQPGMRKNEYRAICELTDRYPYGGFPIFIADRGFPSYNFFAHAKESGVSFITRMKDVNTRRLLGLGELPGSIDTGVEIIVTRTQSKKKRRHPECADRYRYVGPEATFDYIGPGEDGEYPLSLRVIRLEVAPGVFENIATDLPVEGFGADEIGDLYHLRWGIETSFRDLKHTIGATNFHSKKPEYITQEIWARLILFNFCAIITAHVVVVQEDTVYAYQVNFSLAMKICHDFLRLREDKPPPDVEGLIGSYTLPIRPGRAYARQHRFQLPASFCYRFS